MRERQKSSTPISRAHPTKLIPGTWFSTEADLVTVSIEAVSRDVGFGFCLARKGADELPVTARSDVQNRATKELDPCCFGIEPN
jgi:hypothetical protein